MMWSSYKFKECITRGLSLASWYNISKHAVADADRSHTMNLPGPCVNIIEPLLSPDNWAPEMHSIRFSWIRACPTTYGPQTTTRRLVDRQHLFPRFVSATEGIGWNLRPRPTFFCYCEAEHENFGF